MTDLFSQSRLRSIAVLSAEEQTLGTSNSLVEASHSETDLVVLVTSFPSQANHLQVPRSAGFLEIRLALLLVLIAQAPWDAQ